MRRFWAHLILAITAIFTCIVCFTNVFTKTKSNMEYSNAYEVVYTVTEKDDGVPNDDLTPAQNVAKSFEKRLQNYGVSQYEIFTESTDIVKVVFADRDDYTQVSSLLPFNGTLALTLTISGSIAYGDDFISGPAYIDEVNDTYPTVVIPVNTDCPDFKTLIDELQEQETGGIDQSTGEQDEEGNDVKEAHYYAFLWYDFDEDVDNYELAQQDTPEGQHCSNKLLMNFDRDDLYYPDGENNKLYSIINIAEEGTENATYDSVSQAYKKAKFFVNLINAGPLDYTVKYSFSSETASVDPMVDSLVAYGDPHSYVAWSPTLIATIISAILICLFSIMFFKVGALSISACSILSIFASIGFIVAIGAEFTTAGIIGVVLVAIASITSGVIYFSKLKNECYKGRSIKKANAEASKKSLLPIIDVNAVIIIIGVFCYILGGTIMRTFAIASVLGGVVSALVNTLGLKGLAWLATNATSVQGKYSLFGVDQDKVPNFTKEEKQTYFGPFEGKDPTKHKKPIGIIAALLFLGSVAGMIAFGVTNNTNIYNYSSPARNSEIYFQTTEESSLLNNSAKIDEILSKLMVYDENDDISNAKALSTYKANTETYRLARYEKDDVGEYKEVRHFYTIISLNSQLKESCLAYYDEGVVPAAGLPIADVFEVVIQDPAIIGDLVGEGALKEVYLASTPQPHYAPIMLATFVGVAVCTVYFMLRYRFSRGLSTIVMPVIASGITIGLFVLTRIVTTSFISLSIPLIAAVTLMLNVIYLDKEREIISEDTSKRYEVDERIALSNKALTDSIEPIGISALNIVYLGIAFFGFGAKAVSTLFIASTFGAIISGGLILVLFVPMSNMLFKRLKKVDWFRVSPKPHKKKKAIATKKGSEPEEAIFIGIND